MDNLFVLPSILAGLALLFWGRKIFWFLVGTAGFVLGMSLAARWFYDQSDQAVLTMALIFGGLGIFAGIFLQKITVGIAGFLLGAYALYFCLDFTGPSAGVPFWVYLIGGVTGLILSYLLFDWALIILSSLAGAFLIMEQVYFGDALTLLFAAGLFVTGLFVQSRIPVSKKENPKK